MSANEAHAIVLSLGREAELFEGVAPGRVRRFDSVHPDWDAVGETLGEPGVQRLLRLLDARRDAREIVIRLREGAADGGAGDDARLVARLDAWIHASIASHREAARATRRVGAKVLVICVCLLAVVLAAAWVLQEDSVLGPAGPLRTLVAEALIIAGWVFMWRPIELLAYDPLRSMLERRMLARARAMPKRVERAAAA